MATAAELYAIDQAHRQRQAANARAVAMLVLAYWARVDSRNLATSGTEWLTQAMAAIIAGHRQSVLHAFAYTQAVRRLQVPGAEPLELPALPPAPGVDPPRALQAGPSMPLQPNIEQIRKSLTYTGLVKAAQQLASQPPREATESDFATEVAEEARRQVEATNRTLQTRRDKVMMDAGAGAAAAAVRHVQNGGRAAVDELVKRDPVARGWVRITRDDACFFCAMLASRGPIYKGDSFDESDPRFEGPGEHKVHDSCGCSLRPVYTRSMSEWPEASLAADELWRRVAKGKSPRKAILAFRQAYEGRAA